MLSKIFWIQRKMLFLEKKVRGDEDPECLRFNAENLKKHELCSKIQNLSKFKSYGFFQKPKKFSRFNAIFPEINLFHSLSCFTECFEGCWHEQQT